MKQKRRVGIMILTCLIVAGCRSESERLADMANQTVQMQTAQNIASANAHRELLRLNSQLQTERNNLNRQFNELEQNRRDLHRLRRSELAWSESFRFLGITIAAIMPLFLCAYLIWASLRHPDCHEAVNELLIRELVSPNPRLIAAPNLRTIHHQSDDRKPNSNNGEN